MFQAQRVDVRDVQDVEDMMEGKAMAKMEYVLIPHLLWAYFKEEAANRGIEFIFTEDDEWIYIISDLDEAEKIRKKVEIELVA